MGLMGRFDFASTGKIRVKCIDKRYPKKLLLRRKKDIERVKKAVKNTKYELKNFTTNCILELFFNIHEGKEIPCYISKAWDDPGFRIGENIILNKGHKSFKDTFYAIFEICSRNLISIGILKDSNPNNLNLSLEIGIYKDGFNKKCLKEAIATLKECLKNIRPLLKDARY